MQELAKKSELDEDAMEREKVCLKAKHKKELEIFDMELVKSLDQKVIYK